MPEQGWRSYMLYGGDQLAFETAVNSPTEIIYGIGAGGADVAPNHQPVVPVRTTRNLSPIRAITGPIRPRGTVNIPWHVANMIGWWKHILHLEVHGSTQWNGGAWIEVMAATAPSSLHSLDTQPQNTSPTADPGQLRISFDTATSGEISITGTDGNADKLKDYISFASTDTIFSNRYFRSVDANGITLNSSIITDVASLEIDINKNTWDHSSTMSDDVPAGLTMELVRSTVPTLVTGAIINRATVGFRVGEPVSLALSDILAYNVQNGVALDGTGTATDIASYLEVTDTVFPGWALSMVIDGTAYPVESVDLEIDHRLEFPDRIHGSRFPRAPERIAPQDFRIRPSLEYDSTTQEFRDRARNNEIVSATLAGSFVNAGGPEMSFQLGFGRVQFMDIARVPVDGVRNLLLPMELQVLRGSPPVNWRMQNDTQTDAGSSYRAGPIYEGLEGGGTGVSSTVVDSPVDPSSPYDYGDDLIWWLNPDGIPAGGSGSGFTPWNDASSLEADAAQAISSWRLVRFNEDIGPNSETVAEGFAGDFNAFTTAPHSLLDGIQDFTMIAVFEPRSNTAQGWTGLVRHGAAGAEHFGASSSARTFGMHLVYTADTSYNIYTNAIIAGNTTRKWNVGTVMVSSAGSMTARLNGQLVGTMQGSTQGFSEFFSLNVGGFNGAINPAQITGQIAEVQLYNTTMPESQLRSLERALDDKYGFDVNVAQFRNGPDAGPPSGVGNWWFAGLCGWYRADNLDDILPTLDNSDNVPLWKDWSGWGNDLVNSDNTTNPTFVGSGGLENSPSDRPLVRFLNVGGVDSWLGLEAPWAMNYKDEFHIAMIIASDEGPTDHRAFQFTDSDVNSPPGQGRILIGNNSNVSWQVSYNDNNVFDTANVTLGPGDIDNLRLIQCQKDRPNTTLWIKRTNIGGSTASDTQSGVTDTVGESFRMILGSGLNTATGSPPINNFWGRIGEVLIWNRALTPTEVSEVQSYAYDRWLTP